MCLCEGIISWQAMIGHLGPQQIVCYFNLDELYIRSTFWNNENNDVTSFLSRCNFNILQFFDMVSLALNLLLCLDIVFTMRNPFYPHDRRMKFYLPLAVIFAFGCFNLSLERVSKPPKDMLLGNYARAMFSCGFLSIYLIMAISSVAYAYRVNTRPGMSTEVRRDFIWRHSCYVAAYILTWLPYLGFAYFILYTTTIESHDIDYHSLIENPKYAGPV